MTPKQADPRGVIRESYRMDGIGAAECRSIFLDWALGMPGGADSAAAIETLLAEYGPSAPEHPMTRLLRDARQEMAPPRRRGGWRSRRGR